MSKKQEAIDLLAIAEDETRSPTERMEAIKKANAIRADMKVGWMTLTGGRPINSGAIEATLRELILKGEQPKPDPLDEKPAGVFTESSHEIKLSEIDPKLAAAVAAAKPPVTDPVVEIAPKRPTAPKKVVETLEKASKDEERGKLSALVRLLLTMTEMGYAEIVAKVKAEFPDAETTARSVASVASDLRSKKIAVPMRRKAAIV